MQIAPEGLGRAAAIARQLYNASNRRCDKAEALADRCATPSSGTYGASASSSDRFRANPITTSTMTPEEQREQVRNRSRTDQRR